MNTTVWALMALLVTRDAEAPFQLIGIYSTEAKCAQSAQILHKGYVIRGGDALVVCHSYTLDDDRRVFLLTEP